MIIKTYPSRISWHTGSSYHHQNKQWLHDNLAKFQHACCCACVKTITQQTIKWILHFHKLCLHLSIYLTHAFLTANQFSQLHYDTELLRALPVLSILLWIQNCRKVRDLKQFFQVQFILIQHRRFKYQCAYHLKNFIYHF